MGETNGDNKKKTAREIIENYNGPKVRIMEVCGTHTHEIFRLGIRKLLPEQVELISGPGCPVCVTPVSFIDEAIYLSLENDVDLSSLFSGSRKAHLCTRHAHQITKRTDRHTFFQCQMLKNMRKNIQRSR